jgi:hypothetical protein
MEQGQLQPGVIREQEQAPVSTGICYFPQFWELRSEIQALAALASGVVLFLITAIFLLYLHMAEGTRGLSWVSSGTLAHSLGLCSHDLITF